MRGRNQGPGTVIDMHIHTMRGSSDSTLDPQVLLEEMKRIGLTGVSITEHDRLWDAFAFAQLQADCPGRFLYNGIEVSTDLGHIAAIGLKTYVPGIQRAAELRRVLNDLGGYMIVTHPFRYVFDPVFVARNGNKPFPLTPEQAAELPVFQLVDALEVLNGCCTAQENRFALQVAQVLGKPGTGGSDTHSRQGIGYYATAFERTIQTEEEFLSELRAGRFFPVIGLPQGRLDRFDEETFSHAS